VIAPHRQLTGRIVIATHNPGKLREMRELLAPYGIDAVSAGELNLPEPAETGASFRDNARIKAKAAHDQGNARLRFACTHSLSLTFFPRWLTTMIESPPVITGLIKIAAAFGVLLVLRALWHALIQRRRRRAA